MSEYDLSSDDYADAADYDEYDPYEHYEQVVFETLPSELINGVGATHLAATATFARELLCAQAAALTTSDADLLIAYVRAYRSMEWYRQEHAMAIVSALIKPFQQFFSESVKLRTLLSRQAVNALRDRVLYDACGSGKIVELQRAFFKKHDDLRNRIVHGVYLPTQSETATCVLDAIDFYNLTEKAMNYQGPSAIDASALRAYYASHIDGIAAIDAHKPDETSA